jgi:WD40 repeat protein
MFLLDILAKFGLYAPGLIWVWFALAYWVAAYKTRNRQTGKQILSMLGTSLLFLAIIVLEIFLVQRQLNSNLVVDYMWVIYWTFYPLLILRSLYLESAKWRTLGYSQPIEMLLFQNPSPQSLTSSNIIKPDTKRLSYFFFFSISTLLIIINFLSYGLKNCEWLDTITGYTGCVRSIAVNGFLDGHLEFSPDNSVLAINDGTGPLQMFSVKDGSLIRQIPSQGGWGQSLSFSPDNKLLAVISTSKLVSIFNQSTGELLDTLSVSASSLQFSSDGKYLGMVTQPPASKDDLLIIELRRTSDWVLDKTFTAQGSIFSFSPDSQMFASAGLSGTIKITNISDGSIAASLDSQQWIRDISYSADGKHLAVIPVGESFVQIWNVAEGNALRTISVEFPYSADFSADGKLLLVSVWLRSTSNENLVSILDVATGKQVGKITDNFLISGITFSPDGQLFAYSNQDSIKIWRTPKH